MSNIYKNAIKAEQEIVKESVGGKPSNFYYGEYTENNRRYDCLTEGHVLVAFTFNTFVLNKEIFETSNRTMNIAQVMDKNNELPYKTAHLIGTKIVDKGTTYCVLKNDSTGGEILFNEKYQKYFTDDVEYKVYDSKSPIKIYHGEIFMGIIMPIVYMGE